MGGLLSPELTSGTKLTPSVVSQANKVYLQAISAWNKSLSSQGLEPVQPVKAVGSTSYFEQDSTEQPDELERVYGTSDVVYGDVDYLVQFPFPSDFSGDETERRREENKIKREYGQLMQEFFESPNSPKEVKAATSPMLVVELPSGEHVQVDAIVTFPKYSNWMKSRYSSERGLKGYITGNLYAALGDALVLTIGTEGVLARTRGGERVTSRVRKDVIINSVSIDPRNFLMDIARYIIGSDDFEVSPTLQRYSGWDEDAVRISDIGKGIVGLAETLEANVEGFSKKELLSNVLSTFEAKLNGTIDKKRKMMAKKGFDGEGKLSELEKQNEKSLSLMSSIFSSGRGLVDLVKEVKSEMEEGIRADKYHSPEVIEAAINQPGYLVHFSDTTKVGINPHASYNTPVGIYGWLFTDEVFDFDKGWELPYGVERKYAHILKPRDMSKVLWIGDDSAMSGEIPSAEEIMQDVSSAYPQLSEDELSSVSDGYESGTTFTSTIRGMHQGTRTEDVYDFVTFVSDNLGIYVFDDEQKGKAIANKLFRTLGYDAIIDINCIGAIHANEPCQGFFTSTSGMDLVATLDNEYNPRNKTSQTNAMYSESVPVEVFRNAFDEYLDIDVEKTVSQGDDQFEIVNMAKHLSLILDINGHKLDKERLLRLNNFIDKVEELDSSIWHFRFVRAKAADLMKDSPLNEQALRNIIREVKSSLSEDLRIDKHPQADIIKQAIGDPNYLIHFSDLNKIGINPKTKYNTPAGIYGWHFTKDVIKGAKKNRIFASARKYGHLMKVRDGAKVLWLGDDARNDDLPSLTQLADILVSAYPALNEPYEDLDMSVVEYLRDNWRIYSKTSSRDDGGKTNSEDVYNFIMATSAVLVEYMSTGGLGVIKGDKKITSMANKLLRIAGYDAIIDVNCAGIIHTAEACQGFFTHKGGLEHVAVIENKLWKTGGAHLPVLSILSSPTATSELLMKAMSALTSPSMAGRDLGANQLSFDDTLEGILKSLEIDKTRKAFTWEILQHILQFIKDKPDFNEILTDSIRAEILSHPNADIGYIVNLISDSISPGKQLILQYDQLDVLSDVIQNENLPPDVLSNAYHTNYFNAQYPPSEVHKHRAFNSKLKRDIIRHPNCPVDILDSALDDIIAGRQNSIAVEAAYNPSAPEGKLIDIIFDNKGILKSSTDAEWMNTKNIMGSPAFSDDTALEMIRQLPDVEQLKGESGRQELIEVYWAFMRNRKRNISSTLVLSMIEQMFENVLEYKWGVDKVSLIMTQYFMDIREEGKKLSLEDYRKFKTYIYGLENVYKDGGGKWGVLPLEKLKSLMKEIEPKRMNETLSIENLRKIIREVKNTHN